MTGDGAPPAAGGVLRRVIVGIGLFLLVVLGVASWAFGPVDPARFDDRLESLRAAGIATELAACPPEENGADVLDAALAALVASHGNPSAWTVTGPWSPTDAHPWYRTASPERLAELAGRLDGLGEFFAGVDAALDRRVLRWTPPPGAPPDPGRHVSRVQTVQKVLAADAHAGSTPARRLASSARLLRLGDRMELASLIDTMVATAAGSSGRAGLRGLLESGAVPAHEIQAALDAAAPRERLATWKQAFEGEIVHMCNVGRELREAPATHRSYGLPRRWPGPACAAIDAAEIVSKLDPADYAACLARLKEIRDSSEPGLASAAADFLPRFAAADASLRLLRIAVAATVRRERDGEWPRPFEVLAADLGGTLPVDPATGRAFVYSIVGDEMTVEVHLDSPLRRTGATEQDLRDAGLTVSVVR